MGSSVAFCVTALPSFGSCIVPSISWGMIRDEHTYSTEGTNLIPTVEQTGRNSERQFTQISSLAHFNQGFYHGTSRSTSNILARPWKSLLTQSHWRQTTCMSKRLLMSMGSASIQRYIISNKTFMNVVRICAIIIQLAKPATCQLFDSLLEEGRENLEHRI